MAKQQTDDELNLRRKARRRLIGAVALALAVVVILPMVLDSEPKPTGEDIDLRIPAPDKVGEFVPGVAVSEVAEALPIAVSAVAVVSAPVAASAAAPAVAQVTAAVAAPVVAAAVSANPSKLEASGKVEASGKLQPAAVKPAESKSPEVKPQEPKIAQSKPAESKPTESKTAEPKAVESKSAVKTAGAESYVAQIGAYSNADTAKREADKLKKWGFKAYTEKVGDKVRVRVGPYAERDKADKVRKMLEKHGLHPAIVGVK